MSKDVETARFYPYFVETWSYKVPGTFSVSTFLRHVSALFRQ
jgi:hypothetical protein